MPTITFDPASIPRRDKLVISAGQSGAGNVSALKAGKNGGENTGASATGGGNNVVRLHPGSSSIRTHSASENHVARMYCPRIGYTPAKCSSSTESGTTSDSFTRRPSHGCSSKSIGGCPPALGA